MSGSRPRYFVRGVYVACGMLLCFLIIYFVQIGLSYDGKCGGFFPGLSVRKPCSFWDYLSGDVLAIAMIMGGALWPVAVALLALPPLAGYWFDRRKQSRAA